MAEILNIEEQWWDNIQRLFGELNLRRFADY